MTWTGIPPPCNHAAELFPEGRSSSCNSSCRISPVATSQKACGESWNASVMEKSGEEIGQKRLKLISAGLRYRIWEKTTFICYCAIKNNITVWSCSQQWVLNPSANGLCQLFFFQPWSFNPSLNSLSSIHTSPFFFLPLLFSLVVCFGALIMLQVPNYPIFFSYNL